MCRTRRAGNQCPIPCGEVGCEQQGLRVVRVEAKDTWLGSLCPGTCGMVTLGKPVVEQVSTQYFVKP